MAAVTSTAGDILVIDDEQSICYAFERFFAARGWSVRSASSASAGLTAWREHRPDVTFLDVRLPDASGLDLLAQLRGEDPDARVIVITAYGSLETVMQAVKTGSFDYLVKPLDLDRAEELAQRALVESTLPAEANAAGPPADGGRRIVGSSREMQEVYKRIGLVAAGDAGVLISGATGTGKELVARAIHEHSPRQDGPFVAVNCGAIPASLVESELFGHVKGAFTGASADRAGRFEAADGGTLLLDEVGELPGEAQVKLLRVLDSQVIERVGSTQPIHLDVRILAATNRELSREVAEGRFREDLYYRLAVMHIRLPALRERREDIVPLAEHFLAELASGQGGGAILSPEAKRALERADWPGNVRQLRNAMHHAAVVSGGGRILPEHLPESVSGGGGKDGEMERLMGRIIELAGAGEDGLHEAVITPMERVLIRHALEVCDGQQGRAADLLGLHRNTLRKKIRRLGLGDESAGGATG
ncbi:MAG: sigma-54-dependent transcriptional regulator [Planctomycetota bacterium]